MSLTTTDRVRHARQLSLVEIGERGQALLCAARPSVAREADPAAAAVALDYLTRAGLGSRTATDAVRVAVPPTDAVQRLAGDPALLGAAATLAGAFAAVEAIKGIVGAGEAASLPPIILAADPAPPRRSG